MIACKTKDVYEDFSKDKKCMILVVIYFSQDLKMIKTNEWLVRRKMKQLVFQLHNVLD